VHLHTLHWPSWGSVLTTSDPHLQLEMAWSVIESHLPTLHYTIYNSSHRNYSNPSNFPFHQCSSYHFYKYELLKCTTASLIHYFRNFYRNTWCSHFFCFLCLSTLLIPNTHSLFMRQSIDEMYLITCDNTTNSWIASLSIHFEMDGVSASLRL
jgi:hypothetical protein